MLVEFITGLKPGTKLPRACLCKSTLAATLTKRATLLGNRLSDNFVDKAIDKDSGVVNYKDFGVYSWKPEEDDLVKVIMHCGGTSAVIPEEVCIKKAWIIHENYSDTKAFIEHGVLHIKFSQQMPEFNKYNEYNCAEYFKLMAEQVQKELCEILSQAKQGDVSVTAAVLPKPKKRSGPPATDLTKKVAKASVTKD
jgi:hypothetical protein